MSTHPPVLRSPKGDIVLGVKALDGDSRGAVLGTVFSGELGSVFWDFLLRVK